MSFWRRKRRETELEEEVQSHLQMAVQERVERGDTAKDAEHAARREFGNVELVKEVTRDVWGPLDRLMQDLRFGVRMIAKSPGFTAVAILTLALGIGANTALFSVVNGVLLNPLPFPQPEQLVAVYAKTPTVAEGSITYANFLDWHRDARSFSSFAAFRSENFNLTGAGTPERLHGHQISAEFFT